MDRRWRTTRMTLGAAALLLPLLGAERAATGAARTAATSSAREFLAGDFHGTALSATGRLTLGPSMAPVGWPEEAAAAIVFGAAEDQKGRVFVATGGGQGRLFVVEEGRVRTLFAAAEPNVTAVAVAPDGTVVCATSPDGKVYRVDPSGKDPGASGTPWGSPGEAAIWSLAPAKDGSLYVGTGAKGRIYRRDPSGKLDLFFECEDLHVRTLVVGPDGTVFAGTSDKGLVVAIGRDGKGRTLHDFDKPEVTSLVLGKDGSLWAAAVQADGSSGVSARADLRRAPAPAPSPTPAPAREEAPKGSVSVSTSTSRPALAPAPASGNSTEIVVIRPDGFVEPAWTLPEDATYSMRPDPVRGGLLLSTGPRGRVYSLVDRHLRLEVQADERVVVAAIPVRGRLTAVTSSPPDVLAERRDGGPFEGTFTAAVKDASRLARFGRLRFEGDVPKGSRLAFAVRSGNSLKPDGTWSSWTAVAPDGRGAGPDAGAVPTARFFQWRVTLTAPAGTPGPTVERVEFSYADRNARPVLENLTVLEPGAVFPRAGASSGPAVLSVTNPDENGIFAGVEPPKEAADTGGRKLFRKGFRTLTWKGSDPNGDALRYDVELLRVPGPGSFPLRREIEDPFVSFDSSAVPDGRYRFRVTATDRPGNPEPEALTAVEESDVFVVDNTPPLLEVESATVEGSEIVLRVRATDALSPIGKAEGSVNADRWRLLAPDDGPPGALSQRYSLRVPKPPGPAVLGIRIVDGAGNAVAVAAEYPREFRAP